MPADYTAYEMTSYTNGATVAVSLTAQLQFGLECPLTTEEKQMIHFNTVENCGTVWSNQTYIKQTAQGETNIIHEVYLGDGIMVEPPSQQLNPEQHQQVVQAIAQNPKYHFLLQGSSFTVRWGGGPCPCYYTRT